jgi:hypothetical protein
MGCGLAAALAGAAVAGTAVAGAATDAGPPAPPELLERAFRNLYGDDFVQVMALSTRRRGSRPLVRRVQLVRKQSVRPGKSLVRFLDPPEVRRTSVLILEASERYDDLFVFLPALGRIRRVAAGQRADSFFGTDLSYEDVEPKYAEDWDARRVELGSEAGTPCLVLEIRPRRPETSTYERMVSCIEPERALVLRTQFFRDGLEAKQLRVDPRDVREVAGRQIPFVLTMTTPRLRSETVVTTERYDIHPALPEAIFTQSNLETGDAEGDRRAANGS